MHEDLPRDGPIPKDGICASCAELDATKPLWDGTQCTDQRPEGQFVGEDGTKCVESCEKAVVMTMMINGHAYSWCTGEQGCPGLGYTDEETGKETCVSVAYCTSESGRNAYSYGRKGSATAQFQKLELVLEGRRHLLVQRRYVHRLQRYERVASHEERLSRFRHLRRRVLGRHSLPPAPARGRAGRECIDEQTCASMRLQPFVNGQNSGFCIPLAKCRDALGYPFLAE